MQSFEEYRKDFLEDVKATEESEANGTVASFVNICALKLFEGDVIPEYTPCYYQGSGYRNSSLRVDGYAYDEQDGYFYLLIASYSGSEDSEVILGSDAKTLMDRCRTFASNSIEHNLSQKIEISTVAYDLASLIQGQFQFISKFIVILITDMSLSDRAILSDTKGRGENKKKTSILSADPISGIDVEYRVWDMTRFHRMFSSNEGREEIEIDFLQYNPGGIPCLVANIIDETAECKSYLLTVPGNVIADLYDQFGSRLLEGNVRSFLGRRGINKEIRNTVLNAPDKFFVYNNGISATALETVIKDGALVYARDLQIVNGGQTTATLSSTRRTSNADLSKIFVLMKLTQVNPEIATTIVPLISRSANSQNKINPADFFSTHEYHIRMEQISRRRFAPARDGAQHDTHWFYERARGQYIQATMNMTKSEEKKFITQNPKDQVITKTELAKVLSSWDEFPHIVSKGAESNFADFAKRTEALWEKKRDDFTDNYFQESVALIIIFKTIDKLIPKQPWYEKGYKANIVTYSMALLHHLIQKWYPGKTLDFQKIWQKQKCSDYLIDQVTEISKHVYNSITSPDRMVENVTQWCKQSACWERIKKIELLPIEGFETILSGAEEHANIKKEARQDRKIENTLDTQVFVLDLGEEYWKKLENWLTLNRFGTEQEIRALKFATKFSSGIFPDEKQSKYLVNLRQKAVQEGFPPK